MGKLLEDQLILRCKRGDGSAFGELIKIYRSRLYTYLLRFSGNSTMADDLFQETLIKAWKGLPAYHEQERFASWLFSIAHNIAVDEHRKNKVRYGIVIDVGTEEVAAKENQLKELEENELKELIVDSLKHLSEKQRNVFLLRQHSGMSFKEIAETTGQNLNTVLSHMNYAVKKNQEKIKR